MSEQQLFDYLPPVLQRVNELGRISRLEQSEFDRARAAYEQVLQELFPYICSEYGLSRWEKMLGVSPNAMDTAVKRRQVVLLRLSEQLPFTIRRLVEMLALVAPEDQYYIELFPAEYMLRVRLSLIGKSYFRTLQDVLERTLPANLLLDLDLLYNRYGYLVGMTHGELSALHHHDLREEVIE